MRHFVITALLFTALAVRGQDSISFQSIPDTVFSDIAQSVLVSVTFTSGSTNSRTVGVVIQNSTGDDTGSSGSVDVGQLSPATINVTVNIPAMALAAGQQYTFVAGLGDTGASPNVTTLVANSQATAKIKFTTTAAPTTAPTVGPATDAPTSAPTDASTSAPTTAPSSAATGTASPTAALSGSAISAPKVTQSVSQDPGIWITLAVALVIFLGFVYHRVSEGHWPGEM
jgi:hypothetical protein